MILIFFLLSHAFPDNAAWHITYVVSGAYLYAAYFIRFMIATSVLLRSDKERIAYMKMVSDELEQSKKLRWWLSRCDPAPYWVGIATLLILAFLLVSLDYWILPFFLLYNNLARFHLLQFFYGNSFWRDRNSRGAYDTMYPDTDRVYRMEA
jgi:hypothetical protein